ncbi:2-oxo-tetronate isomerase [Devosia aquimaris]|uniref:2-oxo-tetronate isomerase n=1 Tax=Devosia aquimaris TaxID=2866214 RepID=UPI001CD15003|nr:2-oxo-tetronate isomerase [Devosia sp. CJK-A8-3]
MVRLAANLTMMFTEYGFLDRFGAAADAGFDAVEFLFPYEHAPEAIAERLQRHGLTLALFNVPPGDWAAGDRGLAALPERRAEFEAGVATAVDYARVLKPHRLHMMAGLADHRDPLAIAAYQSALRHAAAALGGEGMTLVIEPINPRDMPGYFLNDFNWAVACLGELALPNVQLQYDIYHRQIIHGDVLRSLEALISKIGHVQIAAVPERHEPGSGELDDGRILKALDRLGYAGFVGLEYRPRTTTLEGLAWRRSLGV